MKRFFLLFVLGFGFIVTDPIKAATIYSQTTPEEPNAAFASSQFSPVSQKSADNFSINAFDSVEILSLRFIGGHGIADDVVDDFRIAFLEDVGGRPGAPLVGGDFHIGSAFKRSATGGDLLNGVIRPFEYLVNLPQAVEVNPNTTYWVSITNRPMPSSGWVWARADGELDQMTAATNGSITSGPWDAFATGGMWFELNDRIIPEPSSIGFLLIGLVSQLAIHSRSEPKRGSRR